MDFKSGTLYVVATPIGNLEDISFRAVNVLKDSDLCAAEDTRISKKLFNHYDIKTKLISFHKFSENRKYSYFIKALQRGLDVSLISDAGTPLISDPGFPLVKRAAELNLKIIPIPGPSSILSSLSISGFPLDKFSFFGFPPRKSSLKKLFFDQINKEKNTIVFFESGRRIEKFLIDLDSLTDDRSIFVARELTKKHETFYRGTVENVLQQIQYDKFGKKGEFVIILENKSKKSHLQNLSDEQMRILNILLENLPNNKALLLASNILGMSKNYLYKQTKT